MTRGRHRVARMIAAVALLVGTGARAEVWPIRDWQDLTREEQQRAWENYQRYRQLPPSRQKWIEERHQRFQALPPKEQRRVRRNYQKYRQLDPEKRREFGEKYRRWKDEKR